jgi:hypothetical protein
MNLPHWEYFLSIEADLSECTRYVEFHPDNYNTYSVEFARIIVAASAEFDAVAKALCKIIEPEAHPERISEYFPRINGKYPRFVDYKIHLPRFKIELQPWKDWTATSSPDWWSKGYNKIKHDRDKYFAAASLFNALSATTALLTGIAYLYDATFGEFPHLDLSAGPKLFEPQDDPSGMQESGLFWSCQVWK